MENNNSEKGFVTIGGKKIPLTKTGLPNLIYLGKNERDVIKKYKNDKKKQNQEIVAKEITDLLSKLG
jgi:hypothetical protein